jgi:hypothetical protein
MPDCVQLPMEDTGRRLYFLKFLVVAVLLVVWAKIFGVSLGTFVLQIDVNRIWSLTFGMTAILVVARVIVLCSSRRIRERLLQHGFLRGHFLTWLSIIVLGGLVEETWRAATLNASFHAGFGSLAALIGTSAAFVFCHLLGIPGRNQGFREEVFWEFGVGLTLGGLFIAFRTPLVPIFVNILYHSANLTLTRRLR